MQFKQWTRLKKVIFSSFVFAIITGVITNAITPLFSDTIQFLFYFAVGNLDWIIVIVILLLVFLSIGLLGNRAFKVHLEDMNKKLAEVTREKNELNTNIDFLTADLDKSKQLLRFVEHSLLKPLHELLSAQDVGDLDAKMHQFMKVFLADATSLVPEVYGASLLLPNTNEKDHLTIWESYQVPEDSKLSTKCYIGSVGGKKRGIAGQAYTQGKVVVAHQTHEKDLDGNWKFDNDNYIHFAGLGTYPAFESVVCVPLAEATSSGKYSPMSLGSLCFDSQNIANFDSLIIQNSLMQLGKYVASILLIYYKLRRGL